MSSAQLREATTSLFRIVIGLLFFCHGAASLFGIFGGNRGTGAAVEFGSWPGWWAALIQFVCGGLVMIGLGTRVAALICSGSMAYAYFTVHQEHALLPLQNGGEPAALFCWSFFLIAVIGGGPWSIEGLIATYRERRSRPHPSVIRQTAKS